MAWFKAPKCTWMHFFGSLLQRPADVADSQHAAGQEKHSAPQPALVRAGVGGSHRRPRSAAKPSVLEGHRVAAAFLHQSVTVPSKD